jgi:hypothetical protein
MMNLYHVLSTVERFEGYKDVHITWFMARRIVPHALSYQDMIKGYDALDPDDRLMAKERVDECFTADEAQQVLAWLNANRSGKHEIVHVETTPVESREDGALLMPLGAIPLGGPQDCLMPNEVDWTLPFKVFGYYDLRHHERADDANLFSGWPFETEEEQRQNTFANAPPAQMSRSQSASFWFEE